MPEVYNPSPFGGVQSPYQPNPYQRYEPYQGNQLAQWASLAANIMGVQTTGTPGMMDLGLNRQTNLYGNIQYQHRTKQHSQALMRSYEADTETFLKQIEGAYVIADKGDQFTTKTKQHFLDLHNAFGSTAALMDDPVALRIYDQAHGGRSRMPLAHYIDSPGSRGMQPGMYSDPKQGGQRAADLASSIHQEFFAGGDPTDFTRSGGLKSYQMGEMYQALQTSGKMPDLQSPSGIDPRMKKWSQKDAGKKANDTLKDYAQILGTLNEIFVAEGRMNTPMNELLQAADTLTGGLQQQSKKQAAFRIRSAYEAAAKLGLGSEALIANLEGTSQIAQQYGINQAFGLGMAQYGFEFKGATAGLQNAESWGLRNADELMVMAQGKQAAFVASEGGNRLGMLQRMLERKYADASGKVDASKITGTDPTSTALRALASGDASNPQLAALIGGSDRDFLRQSAGAFGVSVNVAAQEMAMTTQNQEAQHKAGLAGFATGMQRQEFSKMFLEGGGAFGAATDVMVGETIGTGKAARALSERMTKAAGTALMNMSNADRLDTVTRNAKLATAYRETLQAAAKAGDTGAQKMLDTMSKQEGGLERGLQAMGERAYGGLENWMINEGLSPGTLNNQLMMFSGDTERETKARAAETAIDSKVKQAGLGRIDPGGVLDRLAQSIAKAGATGKGDVTSAVQEVLGKDVSGSQARKVAEGVRELQTLETQLQDVDRKLQTEGEGEGKVNTTTKEALKAAATKRREQLQAEYGQFSPAVKKAIEDIEAKNKADSAPGTEEGKLADGGKGGGFSVGSITLVVGGDVVLKDSKVQSVKQNNMGQGATP